MPFYEYRPKSGDCGVCGGCFVDLQKMSDPAHRECPDCGKSCERVISAPIVSVRGSEYKAAANRENRAASIARATGENAVLREATKKNLGQIEGHAHNCALAGCFGEAAQTEAKEEAEAETNQVSSTSGDRSNDTKSRRIGAFPHLVGSEKK